MAKIVYICGMGHNGSTVLDLILDRSEGLLSVGQLNNLLAPQDPREDPDTRRAEFWRAVLSRLDTGEQAELIARNRGVLKEKAFFQHWLLPSQRRAYAAINQKVIDAVVDESRSRCIVDSSKNISRAIGLLPLRGHRLLVVHLIRDVRGFVNSHNLRRRESGSRQQYFIPTMMWFVKNVLASVVLRTLAQEFITLKYEDMLADPEGAFAALEEFIGENLDPSKRAILGSEPVDSSRSLGFSGNRILHSREKIFFDRNRSSRHGVYQSRLYWIACGWISRFWGYRYSAATGRGKASPMVTDKSN